jgi:hypothetical protein
MNPRIILFLGSHGWGFTNEGDRENALSAIIQIEKRTKKIPANKKILFVECGGWAYNIKTGELILSKDKDKGREIFEKVVGYYNTAIEVFKKGGDVIYPDWATILLKYGVDNGYQTILEKPVFDIIWRFAIELFYDKNECEDKIQTDRDEIFVDQLMESIEKNPDKVIIVVRGKKHVKWLPDILDRRKITYEIINYPDFVNILDLFIYKLNKKLHRVK